MSSTAQSVQVFTSVSSGHCLVSLQLWLRTPSGTRNLSVFPPHQLSTFSLFQPLKSQTSTSIFCLLSLFLSTNINCKTILQMLKFENWAREFRMEPFERSSCFSGHRQNCHCTQVDRHTTNQRNRCALTDTTNIFYWLYPRTPMSHSLKAAPHDIYSSEWRGLLLSCKLYREWIQLQTHNRSKFICKVNCGSVSARIVRL